MIKYSGNCPLYGETTILIDYLDASTLTESSAIKGLFQCPHVKNGKCPNKNCPIYEDAPDKIQV